MDDNFEDQLGAAMEERFKDDGDEGEDDLDERTKRASAERGRSDVDEREADPVVEDDADESGPPYSYDEASVNSVYPEGSTWRSFKATRSTLDARLIQNHGLDDLEKREVDNAALQLAADHPDLLEAYILKNRGRADDVALDVEDNS